MLVIRIELWSHRTGEKTELARMHITNTGEANGRLHNYIGQTFRGRSSRALDRLQASRTTQLTDWPRDRLHVWSLVATMLAKMGYGISK